MMDILTRKARNDEIPYLHHIWKTVFNDGGEELFFNHYFDPDLCAVVTMGDAPVAAGYLFPAGNVIYGDLTVPYAMIYAVAVLPEYRSLGYGTAVVHELISTGRSIGYPAIGLCPSSDGLFEYYSSRTELRDWFYICEQRIKKAPAVNAQAVLTHVACDEYALLRKTLIAGILHIEPDLRTFTYQKMLCDKLGGGLFRIDSAAGTSCAIVERQTDSSVWIKELLTPKTGMSGTDEASAVSAIASAFPAKDYVVRTPARRYNPRSGSSATPEQKHHNSSAFHNFYNDASNPKKRRFGMITAPENLLNAPSNKNAAPWLGLAFD